jgi:LPXTG-motif cell wall-anchored protein
LNVLALRADFGGFDRPQNLDQLAGPDSGLYDLSHYRAALAAPVAPAAPAAAPGPPAAAAPRPAAAAPTQLPAQLPRTGDLPLPFIPAAAVGLALLVGGLIRRRCS